jgi:hypothetical protein
MSPYRQTTALKPGMTVRVIDTRANMSRLGDVGTILHHGCDPDSNEPAGWVVRFSFKWYRLGWNDHLFENQLEPIETRGKPRSKLRTLYLQWLISCKGTWRQRFFRCQRCTKVYKRGKKGSTKHWCVEQGFDNTPIEPWMANSIREGRAFIRSDGWLDTKYRYWDLRDAKERRS